MKNYTIYRKKMAMSYVSETRDFPFVSDDILNEPIVWLSPLEYLFKQDSPYKFKEGFMKQNDIFLANKKEQRLFDIWIKLYNL